MTLNFSGAGKSTLMSALAYRNMSKFFCSFYSISFSTFKCYLYASKMPAETEVKGEILLNNRPIGPFMHRLSGFIHQDDLFDGTLTVLEHLTFVVSYKKVCTP